MPSLVKNSNAAAIFRRAAAIGSSPAAFHGRSSVPTPNMSRPSHANECQKHTPGRSQSTIRLPSTTRSGSYALNASGSVEPLPPNGMRSGTSVKNGSAIVDLLGVRVLGG